uniref:Ig-like domain-containing protein n=1 Tax=Poecilia formosa TaxID=48698 RepID=A0A096M401_POEFO
MTNFTFLLPLLWTLSCVRLTLCRFHSMAVQAGEDVTLSCTNLSRLPSHISWSKLADGGDVSCISSMTSSESRAVLCDGGQSNKYIMTSNGTNIFLNVKEVNLLDAGVYICGLPTDEFQGMYNATYLRVEGDSNHVSNNLLILILGSVVVFLLLV